MGEIIGHNVAKEWVDLFGMHEKHIHGVMELQNQKIEHLVKEMEELEFFLSKLKQQSDLFEKDKTHKITISHADAARIKSLSENEDLRHIFSPTQFTWADEEIPAVVNQIEEKIQEWSKDENLKRLLEQRIQGPLQRQISMTTEKVLLEQQDLTKVLEIFNSCLKRMNELISQIQANISRTR